MYSSLQFGLIRQLDLCDGVETHLPSLLFRFNLAFSSHKLSSQGLSSA
jgi:hypothetical protein